MKIKPVEIMWANSRHSEVQKRLIKFNHLHAKNESYLHTPFAEPFLKNQGFIKSFFVLNHCIFSCKNGASMLSLGDPNLTTKTVSAMIPIVVLLLVRATTSNTRYRCTKGLHINSCHNLQYHCVSYLLLDIHFNYT